MRCYAATFWARPPGPGSPPLRSAELRNRGSRPLRGEHRSLSQCHEPADAGRGEPRFPCRQGAGGGRAAGAGPVSPGFGQGLQRCAPDAPRPGWVNPLRPSAPLPSLPPALAGRRLGRMGNRSAYQEGRLSAPPPIATFTEPAGSGCRPVAVWRPDVGASR